MRLRMHVGLRVPVILRRLRGRLVAVRRLPPFGARRPVADQIDQAVDEEARQREERNEPDQVLHPRIVSASSMFRVFRCRKSAIVRARPIAASPAAIVITKTEKTCPVRSDSRRENAIRFRLTAFIISSTDIRTVRKFRRTRTPRNPIAKSRKLMIR